MPRDLVLGNGSLLVAFDDQYAIRDLTWPHVGQENHVMGRRCRVGLQVDGRTTWLGGDGWDGDLEYLPDTLVGSSTFRSADLGLVVSVRDAVLDTEPVLVRSFEIEDTLGRDRDLVLWCHHDFDILESDAFNAVTWDPTTRALLHHKRDRYFLTRVIASGAVLWSCDARSTKNGRGVAGKIEDGDVCDHNPVSIGSVDGAVGDVARVPAGGRTRVHAWLCVGRSEAQVVRRHGQVAAAGVDALIAESARRDHQRVGRIGADWDGLPGDIATGARRAWLVVSTQSDAGGGISAANDSETLFPGRETYAYLWPRDAALACAALDRAGDHETSRRFFALCPKLLSPDGWLGHRYWADGTPGSSWLARVRDGRPVPPIQEDETSLVLWAAGEHLRRAPDHGFASTFYDGFVRPAADFVAEYRDPDTRLPLPSWDLWEERYGVHSFTVATVIAGLRAAAEIASRLGC
ncbi:MAG: glycosyl hydrolase, partial [Planctomycetes bacterium]|nr:glycosyl hydrolase [Planctomycetota bacterium]